MKWNDVSCADSKHSAPPDLYIVMRSALCNFCYEVINITCKGYWSLLNPLIHHKIYSYGVDERIGLTLFWLTRFAIAKLVEYHLLIQSWKVGNSHSKRFNVIVRLFSMISCQKNDHCTQWQSIFEKWQSSRMQPQYAWTCYGYILDKSTQDRTCKTA